MQWLQQEATATQILHRLWRGEPWGRPWPQGDGASSETGNSSWSLSKHMGPSQPISRDRPAKTTLIATP